MNGQPLEPRRHEPPAGWSAEVFHALTDSLAAVLVAAYRRDVDQQTASRDVEPA